jgi:hypothetical protein
LLLGAFLCSKKRLEKTEFLKSIHCETLLVPDGTQVVSQNIIGPTQAGRTVVIEAHGYPAPSGIVLANAKTKRTTIKKSRWDYMFLFRWIKQPISGKTVLKTCFSR